MLEAILYKYQHLYLPVLPWHLQYGKALILDLSGADSSWLAVNVQSPQELAVHTQKLMQANDAVVAIGRYGEDRRFLYQRSELFQTADHDLRSIHLGIDLTVPANTPIFAPLAGSIHSYNNNQTFGDYGPTIILQHQLDELVFYTLYGHLSLSTLQNLYVGKKIPAGEKIGEVGGIEENGNWPPHLHFQIISDLLGNFGDFPGVVDAKNKEKYLTICPDPNLILRITELKK